MLYMLDNEPLASIAKFNLQPSAKAALRSYQVHYQPL
jgi:hypothetical protein